MTSRYVSFKKELEWWAKFVMRYLIGGGGLVWECVIRGFQDPIALLGFMIMATSLDAFTISRALLRAVRDEAERIEKEVREEMDRDEQAGHP